MIVAGREVSCAPCGTALALRTWMPTELNCTFSVKLMGRLRLAMVAVLKAVASSTGPRESGRQAGDLLIDVGRADAAGGRCYTPSPVPMQSAKRNKRMGFVTRAVVRWGRY